MITCLYLILTLIVGATRMGKTFGVIEKLTHETRKILALDPQDSLSRRLFEHHICQGSIKKLLYDQIRRTDRAPGFISLWESEHKDPLQRLRENDYERSLIAEPLYGRRSLDGVSRPRIAEYTDEALKVMQFQDAYAPLYWLPFAIQPHLPDFEFLLRQCNHQDTVARLQSLAKLSPGQLRNEVSPTLRLLEPVCRDPAFIARCGTLNCDDLINRYDTLIVEGSGATDQTIEIVLQLWTYKAIQYVERHKRSLVLVIDEAANWHLITKDLLRAVATLEKYGFELILITQTLSIVSSEIRVTLFQNARRVECYRVGSLEDARLMSGIFGALQYDPGATGGVSGQGKALIQELMTLPVGTRYVREQGRVFKEQSPILKDSYAWPGISEHMMQDAIQEIIQGTDYQTPKYCTPASIRGRQRGSNDAEQL